MWWGRRDSLVRISALSLFLSNGVPSPVCKNVLFVFNGDETETAAVMSMTSSVCNGLTPTEYNMVSMWKTAAKTSSNIPLSASREHPVVCNYYPPASSSSTSSSSQATDKRSLLRELQSSCPLSFLREWKLNGSEDLILKKSSRGHLEAAVTKWRSEQGGGHSGGQRRLERMFIEIFERLIPHSVGNSSRTTLLLLHENYEQTLPIYSRGGDSSGDSSDASDASDEHIICLLGAVRDASDAEVAACLAAVAARNAPHPVLSEARVGVASFNLGRTAEFTSKICAALCIHAMAGGDLQEAVRRGSLSPVVLPPPKLPPARSGGWNWDGRGNKKVSATATTAASSCLSDQSARALRVVFVLQVPLSASELQQAILKSASADDSSGGGSGRENLHGLVQAVVCALWRSRLGSEGAEASDAASVGGGSVTPSVALVFRDKSHVVLTQTQICLELAAMHQAAPTEKQVLLAIEMRLGGSHVSAPCASLSAALDAALLESAAAADVEWCRVSLKGVSPLWPSAAPSDNAGGSLRRAISHYIYRAGKEREKDAPCGNLAFLFSSGEDEEKDEKEKIGDEWVRLQLVAGQTVSAGLGICGIIQWAHSMRLEAGVSRALHKAAKKRSKRKREGEEASRS